MEIICLKWGDKFNHEHVNRLYKMVCKNYNHEFNFICYTENPSLISRNVETRNLDLSDDLEKWWWKLTLFKEVAHKPTMFLDLDVVIQNDITHYKNYFLYYLLYLSNRHLLIIITNFIHAFLL